MKTKLITIRLVFLFCFVANVLFAQNKEIHGFTVTGIKGIKKSVKEILIYDASHPLPHNFLAPLMPELHGPTPQKQDPQSKAVSKSGILVNSPVLNTPTLLAPVTQAIHSNFLSIWGSYTNVSGRESPYIPPDNMGDVGTTQIIATTNTRMKVFNKVGVMATALTTPTGSSTTTLPAVLNVDLNTFFKDTSLGISGISDPHVRFDRLTQRWFIVAIDVTHTKDNYCCIGVSDGPTISSNSDFTIYYFNVSGTGGSSVEFFDYPTLGVDKKALYIGGNLFKAGKTFSGCTMWVVNKADLLSGTLTVTSFTQSASGTDMYTPQGVHNDDPSATNGYFIGASQTAYSRLVLKRVSYTGTTPTLSSDINLSTLTTYTPMNPPSQGGIALDGDDRRLVAAMIHENKITHTSGLWVAQGSLMNSAGIGGSGGDRDGAVWFEIGNLSTSPAILLSASMCDTSGTGSSIVHYTYPSIAESGQGHNIMGFTSVGASKYAQAGVAGRYRTNAPGTFNAPVDITNTISTYNPSANRWGDFTQTVVDPSDDMTMWTFTEYAPTNDSWGVRAAQLKAPPPATPVLTSTPSCGTSAVTINGISNNNAEFFDPGDDTGGPGFNRLQVSITGPSSVGVSNVVFVNPTQITASVTLSPTADADTYALTVTNPDGQSSSTSFIYGGGCPTEICSGIEIPSSISGTTYQWQLSTDGVNFNGIIDNSNYSGTNADTLHLTNAPTSWYGYQYRCAVDGNYSNTFTLRFTDYWTGAMNSDWENPGNWSCGTLPDANTDVIINSGTAIVNSNSTIRSLSIAPSVKLTVNSGFKLTINH
ncbi:MAG: hypothetical protein Q8891_07815 [Bacteroidota bacterium]|nr:hypothetical protein [Bacteroidota bacterium]